MNFSHNKKQFISLLKNKKNFIFYKKINKFKSDPIPECIKIVEKNIEPYDVSCADEAFITGTPFCMLPVTSFRYRKIGTGEFGEISQKILNQWSKNVGLDIKQQIINYDLSNKDIVTGSTPYKHSK